MSRTSSPIPSALISAVRKGAVTAAELKWVKSVVDDLSAGRLEWKMEDLADIAKNFTPPDAV